MAPRSPHKHTLVLAVVEQEEGEEQREEKQEVKEGRLGLLCCLKVKVEETIVKNMIQSHNPASTEARIILIFHFELLRTR